MSAAATPFFSLIVPVYQAEDYLASCLDSILSQDFEDLEVICVNDGSTDASGDILADYAARDERVIILEQKNKGLSAARNRGIEVARGKYLMFVDSDDYLEQDACFTLWSAFESSGAEIVTFGAHAIFQGEPNPWTVLYLSPRDVTYTGFDPALLFQERSQPYVWRTALEKSFLDRTHLLFDESLRFGEDAVFHFLAYPQSKKTLLLSAKLYNYRAQREGSLMAERKDSATQRIKDHFQIIQRIVSGWDKLGLLPEYGTELFEWVVGFIVNDIAKQSEGDQGLLLKELGGILAPYLTVQDLGNLGLMRSTRWILRSILRAPGAKAPRIRWAQWEYYRRSKQQEEEEAQAQAALPH